MFGQQFLWEKSYKVKNPTDTGFTTSYAKEIIKISDSTYLVGYGFYEFYGVNKYFVRCALAKINYKGDTLWTKPLNALTGQANGVSNLRLVFSFLPIKDDTTFWLISGVGDPFSVSGTRRGFVMHKVSYSGDILYKVNALQNLDIFYYYKTAISLGSDGIIAMGNMVIPSDTLGIRISKISALGVTIWDTVLKPNAYCRGSNLSRKKNGNIFCSGYEGSRIWSIELNPDGHLVETHTWFQDPEFVVWSDAQVISTGDSGYIVRGANTNNTRTYLARYDTNRNKIWGGFQSIRTSVPYVFADGGFILVPSFRILTRFRADSSIKWSISTGIGLIPGGKSISDMYFFSDESVLAVGMQSLSSLQQRNVWLARITNFGQPVPVYLEVKDGPRITENLIPWPNPASDKIFLKQEYLLADIKLYTTAGREVGQYRLQSGAPIDISGLEQGMYLYRAMIDGKGYSGKIIKQ